MKSFTIMAAILFGSYSLSMAHADQDLSCSAYCTFNVHGTAGTQSYGRNFYNTTQSTDGMIVVTASSFDGLRARCEQFAQSALKNSSEQYGEVSVFSTLERDWVPIYVNFGHYKFRVATPENSCIQLTSNQT